MPGPDRRDEKIKAILEYVKVGASLLVLGSLVVAVLQWKLAIQNAEEANRLTKVTLYQRITGEWREQLKTIVKEQDVRPYFEEAKLLDANATDRNKVLAVADLRLDVIDATLTYFKLYGASDAEIAGWISTFSNAFRTSSVLCTRLREAQSSYANAAILSVAKVGCRAK